MSISPEERRAFVIAVQAISEALQALGSVPSGRLYAVLMPLMTLRTYERMIGALKDAGFVREANGLLTWQEPEPKKEVAGA